MFGLPLGVFDTNIDGVSLLLEIDTTRIACGMPETVRTQVTEMHAVIGLHVAAALSRRKVRKNKQKSIVCTWCLMPLD